MNKFVFRQKGSRVYRGRYKLANDPELHDVPLGTPYKHVAEAKLRDLVREREEELAGLNAPKLLRDAALKPIAEHLADHVANLVALRRSAKHVAFTRNRIKRLCEQCGWRLVRDITADGFTRWRVAQGDVLGPKTLNEYLGHLSAFLTWLEKKGQLAHHPLKSVSKVETRGQERCKRRSLTAAELASLVESSGPRGLIYLLAAYTGLRRGEIRSLFWADLHLDEARPFILARASTTKNKKTAPLPLLPVLAQSLRDFRASERVAEGKVFRKGTPSPKTFRRDRERCKIAYLDELGRRVDFHSLRHTFATFLHNAGVSPRVVMELMRHSDMRLSANTYTDAARLPVYTELEKLPAFLPSPLASPKSVFSCPNAGKPVQSAEPVLIEKITVFRGEKAQLSNVVPFGENAKLAEREGFEPLLRIQAKSPNHADLVDC
jgi:integrase